MRLKRKRGANMPDLFQSETTPGEPIKAGDKEITPFSKSLKIMIPGFTGGLIWNRPHSILVQSADGDEQIYPVIDVTRQVLWLLMGVSIVGILFMLIFSNRKHNKK